MKTIVNFGLTIFLCLTILIAFAYFFALYDKISRPNFKNLSYEDYGMIGVLIVIFLICDFFILKRLLGKKKI